MSTPLPRELFRVTQNYAYFNHAAVGIPATPTVEALHEFIDAQAQAGILGTLSYELNMPSYRSVIGRFIGASGSEIAVLRNTTEGAQVLANSIDWEEGDEIVLSDNEFPANAQPWLGLRRRGVVIRYVNTDRERLTPDVLRRTMSPKTKVVAVSWVGFEDGYMHDLAALAEVTHERDALFFVDAMQALGAFPIDVRAQGIDALYCGGAKWMMALQGVSFLYVASDSIERLAPLTPGWRSVADIWDFLNYDQPLAPDATRYEGGTPNFIGAVSLERAIGVFERYGKEAIAAHVLSLTDRLVDGLARLDAVITSSRAAGTRSGIVTFTLPDADPVQLGKALQHDGFVTTYRASGVRVAPHGYNTAEEIDAFVAAAAEHGKTLACSH